LLIATSGDLCWGVQKNLKPKNWLTKLILKKIGLINRIEKKISIFGSVKIWTI